MKAFLVSLLTLSSTAAFSQPPSPSLVDPKLSKSCESVQKIAKSHMTLHINTCEIIKTNDLREGMVSTFDFIRETPTGKSASGFKIHGIADCKNNSFKVTQMTVFENMFDPKSHNRPIPLASNTDFEPTGTETLADYVKKALCEEKFN